MSKMKEIEYTGPENASIDGLVRALNNMIKRGEASDEIVHHALTDLYNLVGYALAAQATSTGKEGKAQRRERLAQARAAAKAAGGPEPKRP